MQPRSRDDRHFFKHKENLERERLRNRTGGYFRYEDLPMAQPDAGSKDSHNSGPGTGSGSNQSKSTMTNDPQWISEKERHTTGGTELAARFLAEREETTDKRNALTEAKRQDQIKREEFRWESIEHRELHEQDRQKRLQEDPLIGKKNVSGVPYNIVSTEYHDSKDGRRLRYNDELIKYRGECRKSNLAEKAHLGYNPITGEQVFPIPPVDKIAKPDRPNDID